MKELELIQTNLDQAKIDAEKLEKGNKSAGVRLRKALQTIKVLCQDIRKATIAKD